MHTWYLLIQQMAKDGILHLFLWGYRVLEGFNVDYFFSINSSGVRIKIGAYKYTWKTNNKNAGNTFLGWSMCSDCSSQCSISWKCWRNRVPSTGAYFTALHHGSVDTRWELYRGNYFRKFAQFISFFAYVLIMDWLILFPFVSVWLLQGRDLSPVTNKLWKKFFERQFGAESAELVVERMKKRRVEFKWRELYKVIEFS